jgi:hypothetical protein
MTYRFSIFALALLFLVPATVLANSGKVVSLHGGVEVNGKSISIPHVVRGGDTIATDENGRVTIVMSDKSVIDIQPQTTFTIERFTFKKAQPKQSSSVMNLLKGSFRYISGLIGRNDYRNARIKMATVTAGLRGSFATFSFDGTTATADVEIGTGELTFQDGSSIVINRDESGTVNINTGASSTISSPSQITAIAAALIANPEDTAALQDLSVVEKTLLVAVMVAEQETLGIASDALIAAVSTVTSTAPEAASVITSAATMTAKDINQAQLLRDSISNTDGVDADDVQGAFEASDDIFDDTGDADDAKEGEGTGETEATADVSGTTSSSASGGTSVASPSEP